MNALKQTLAASALALTLLCGAAACGKQTPAPAPAPANPAPATAAPTDYGTVAIPTTAAPMTGAPTSAAAPTTAAPTTANVRQAAQEAYLDTIRRSGEGGCFLYDLSGDGLPELFLITSVNEKGHLAQATVYTYEDQPVVLGTVEDEVAELYSETPGSFTAIHIHHSSAMFDRFTLERDASGKPYLKKEVLREWHVTELEESDAAELDRELEKSERYGLPDWVDGDYETMAAYIRQKMA